eukprot:190061_1
MSRSNQIKEITQAMFCAKPNRVRMFDGKLGGAYHIIRGKPMMTYIDHDIFNDYHLHYETSPYDIFISAYMKCGCHFMKKIMLEIMKHSKDTKSHIMYENQINLGYDIIPYFEGAMSSGYLSTWCAQTEGIPRISFTHANYRSFPAASFNKNTKIIQVIREPKDAMVSAAFFMHVIWAMECDEKDKATSVDNWYRHWMNGNYYNGDYFDHHLDWYYAWKGTHDRPMQNTPQILWLYFEDLVRDPMPQIRKITSFLNANNDVYNIEFEENKRDIEDIVQRVQFKKVVDELVANKGNLYEKIGIYPSDMFRKGVVGDYKNHLSLQQIDEMDRKTYVRFSETDIRYWLQIKDKFALNDKKSEYV